MINLEIIKKKLNSFRKPNGVFRNVSGELLVDVLRAWENYLGPLSAFAKEVGVRQSQLKPLIHKARKIAKTTEFADGKFKEIRAEAATNNSSPPMQGRVELIWDNGKIIRFADVESLIEFLKKIA